MKTKKTNDFHFKTFSVVQQVNAMKVNTDSVILGAFTTYPNPKKALDIGTGTGLLALMLAHKHPKINIDAIEIEKESLAEAQLNFTNSKWSNNIKAIYKSLQDFTPSSKYDLIITNPPYFINSSKNKNQLKTNARHTDRLSFDEIITFTKNNLTQQGILSLILPKTEGDVFEWLAIQNDLFLTQKLNISPLPNKNVNRVVLFFSKEQPISIIVKNMLVYKEVNKYSQQHYELTKEFYLEKLY
jgi:tRNA1Val (adenine37-N6)-methyltransferase